MFNQLYHLTRMQLREALRGAIGMYLEYRDIYGKDDETAQVAGADEILDGLDADRELAASDPTERLRLQLPDATADLLAACEATMDYWQETGFSECEPGCTCIVDLMRAAIAKARGE